MTEQEWDLLIKEIVTTVGRIANALEAIRATTEQSAHALDAIAAAQDRRG